MAPYGSSGGGGGGTLPYSNRRSYYDPARQVYIVEEGQRQEWWSTYGQHLGTITVDPAEYQTVRKEWPQEEKILLKKKKHSAGTNLVIKSRLQKYLHSKS